MRTDALISRQEAAKRWPLFGSLTALSGAIFLGFWLCSPAAASMSGSGFVIQQNGYILTNYHVINKASRITVTIPGRQAVSARLVTADQEKDLAILQVSLSNLTSLPIASSETVQVLDSITVLGYPLPTELGT